MLWDNASSADNADNEYSADNEDNPAVLNGEINKHEIFLYYTIV